MEHRYNKEKRDKTGLLLQDKEIMKRLLKGRTRPEICRELDLPLGTLNSAVTRIYKTLGCHGQKELILKYANTEEQE